MTESAKARARSIILTGASSGIGRALAGRLAAPGVSMLLIGRDSTRLGPVAEAAAAAGATAETAAVDVADRNAMQARLEAFDARFPVDLVIANAGISAGLEDGAMPEAAGVSDRVAAVNYLGMLHTVEPLLPRMIARRRGQVALMSSLAALRPHPDMPSYSATKAAVRAYGIALRGSMRPHGLEVSVICPGFVTSPMSARHLGFKPFEIPAERAADKIAAGLAARRALIAFPWPLVLLSWLGNRLPPALSDRFLEGFRARIAPDERGG
ncbi:MAG: SDR family NAD(P)-dependent oxidoreductase [Pseudomonadota bacterium]